MTVNQLKEKLNLTLLCEGSTLNTEITGCFAGDLLSLAMSGVESGNAWVTVQTNMNILGISALTEASCVIVANSMNIPTDVIEKAKEEEITLLKSEMTTYELCKLIGENI